MIDVEIFKDLNDKFDLAVYKVQELTGGYLNKKYNLLTNKGSFLLKVYSNKRYNKNKILFVESGLYRQHELHKLGIKCPKLHVYNTIIQHVKSYNYVLMDFIKGTHKDYESITEQELYDLGELTGLMHHYFKRFPKAGEKFDIFANFQRLKEANKALLGELDNRKVNEQYRTIVYQQHEIINNITPNFLAKVPIGFSHADYASDNVIFNKRKVSAIIDFDRCRYTSKWQDIGRALLSYTLKDKHLNNTFISSFINGYNKHNCLSFQDALNSLRYTFIHESDWWIKEQNFNTKPNDKVSRFVYEMQFLADNFFNLSKN
ncbi:phosphotransferase [Clostridium sp. 'deep sea']|uniref:phosphotransferase n=1 Tax=Clostridium sp. 'deep sea' TaxID=2779445 RepID=UPI0018964165|nr:phosphotransferase [Clostridium sp. 'deep sea']QOR35487.1 phosphotransferase [Clostridium sp. 'deep sea']